MTPNHRPGSGARLKNELRRKLKVLAISRIQPDAQYALLILGVIELNIATTNLINVALYSNLGCFLSLFKFQSTKRSSP